MASDAAEITAMLTSELTAAEALRSMPRVIADKAADYAKSIAPIGTDRDPHPGAFRDSIGSRDIGDVGGMPAAQVFSDLDAASYIEYGTSRTPEHATFAKTADHFKDIEGIELRVGSEALLQGLPESIDTSGEGWSILE